MDNAVDVPLPCRAVCRAFTLIELLVVIAVIALLLAILLPGLARARGQARTTRCAANLHSLGLATNLYLDEYNGVFFRYYTDILSPAAPFGAPGRLWWFGFEPNGPGSGTNRPLDKSKSPLAPYTSNLDRRLQCPAFPYDDGQFFPKFDQQAASYGVNISLTPASGQSPSRSRFLGRLQEVFIFADGLHFDFNPGFNEAHYIQYNNPLIASGYPHFRHNNLAQYVLLDGHVDSQPLAGPAFQTVAGAPTGNLSSPAGANHAAIYGN